MTVGDKIRIARVSKGLSQAELSQKLGLGKTGERISQYENGARKPKEDLLQQLAKELDVSIDAISETSFDSTNKIMHALFELEQEHPLYLKKEKDGYAIVIKNDSRNFQSLMYGLDQWYMEKQKQPDPEEYKRWQLTYPAIPEENEWIECKKVEKMYVGLKSKKFTEDQPLKTLPEFLDVVARLIDSDIEVLCSEAHYTNPLMIWGVISFNTNDLLNAQDKEPFVDFLACCDQMTDLYDEKIAVSRHTFNDNVYVDYYFKHAAIIEAIRIFCQLARESEYWPMSQEEMEKSRKNRLEEFAEVVFE